jgi:hypothetical protein
VQGAPAALAPCRAHRPGSCRSAWNGLIAKVSEIEPMVCPQCGSQIKLIAVNTNPFEVTTILRHLDKIGWAPPGRDASPLN